MKSLRHICIDTEQAFASDYPFLNIGKLEELATEWVGNAKILAFNIKDGEKLLIVMQDDKNKNFSLLRFFPKADGLSWYVSIDAQGDLNVLFECMLKKY